MRLPDLFAPQFLALILDLLEQGRWDATSRQNFDSLDVLAPGPAFDLLHFVANWPALLTAVGRIAGCGPLTWFDGWVYRMRPHYGHHDDWHTDDVDGRLVGLSVNLSTHPYRGGVFQMRRRGSEQLIVEAPNTKRGDALLFRISKDLLHRVTPMEGTNTKIAFAGWFNLMAPSFLERLHGLAYAAAPLSMDDR